MIIYRKTRSDILQGQALFRGVTDLLTRGQKEKMKKRKIEKKKNWKKEKLKKNTKKRRQADGQKQELLM